MWSEEGKFQNDHGCLKEPLNAFVGVGDVNSIL